MPVCPNCGYEYIKGITFCPDCKTQLIDESEYLKPEEWIEDNWEIVYTSSEEYEVEMLRDNLEAAGIKSAILSQKDRNFPSIGDFAVVKLLVQKDNLNDALMFIQQIKSESEHGDAEQ